MADNKKKQLVFNIIDFLRISAQDGTVKEDDKESLEVAGTSSHSISYILYDQKSIPDFSGLDNLC